MKLFDFFLRRCLDFQWRWIEFITVASQNERREKRKAFQLKGDQKDKVKGKGKTKDGSPVRRASNEK